jgi:hypothetical protein
MRRTEQARPGPGRFRRLLEPLLIIAVSLSFGGTGTAGSLVLMEPRLSATLWETFVAEKGERYCFAFARSVRRIVYNCGRNGARKLPAARWRDRPRRCADAAIPGLVYVRGLMRRLLAMLRPAGFEAPLQRSHRRCVPLDLNDGRLLEFTPNNQSFDQLASFQCFLYNLTSTGAPGTKSGWNFSLCTVFHDGVTEYCIDKTCQVG